MAEFQPKLCLIGKTLSRCPLSPSIVKRITYREWKCERDFTVDCIGDNIFTFVFQDKDDLQNVLRNGPWKIYGSLLILVSPNEMDFNHCDFWVQIHGLPEEYSTPENGQLIAKRLGDFLCIDEESFNGQTPRLRVKLNINYPLLSGLWFKQGIWIDFKYENLCRFCFKCGHVGQDYKSCMYPHPPGNESFGPWLMALPINGGVGTGKEQTERSVGPVVSEANAEEGEMVVEEENVMPALEDIPSLALSANSEENLARRLKSFVMDLITSSMMPFVMNSGVVLLCVTLGEGNRSLLIFIIASLVYRCRKVIQAIKARMDNVLE